MQSHAPGTSLSEASGFQGALAKLPLCGRRGFCAAQHCCAEGFRRPIASQAEASAAQWLRSEAFAKPRPRIRRPWRAHGGARRTTGLEAEVPCPPRPWKRMEPGCGAFAAQWLRSEAFAKQLPWPKGGSLAKPCPGYIPIRSLGFPRGSRKAPVVRAPRVLCGATFLRRRLSPPNSLAWALPQSQTKRSGGLETAGPKNEAPCGAFAIRGFRLCLLILSGSHRRWGPCVIEKIEKMEMTN